MLRNALAAVFLLAFATPAFAQPGIDAFYSLTNDASDNEVQIGIRFFGLVFPWADVSTGGAGTAAGLGSQGALTTSDHGRYLLAVNPGSDDVTLFRNVGGLFLLRADIAATGGRGPTSVTVHGDLVYVLNADSDDVSGFRLANHSLQPIGRFPLSGDGVAAAQVEFSPSGRQLVVTERMTNQILVFPVLRDGSLGAPNVNASSGQTPFGFAFRNDGTLVVSEAFGGQTDLSAATSYSVARDGSLQAISVSVPTNQTAACWTAIPRNGRFAYTTNTGSASVTGYFLARDGSLIPLDRDGVTGRLQDGAAPIDLDFNRSGQMVYVLDSAHDEIVAFRRDGRGRLRRLFGSLELPDGAAGLVAR